MAKDDYYVLVVILYGIFGLLYNLLKIRYCLNNHVLNFGHGYFYEGHKKGTKRAQKIINNTNDKRR